MISQQNELKYVKCIDEVLDPTVANDPSPRRSPQPITRADLINPRLNRIQPRELNDSRQPAPLDIKSVGIIAGAIQDESAEEAQRWFAVARDLHQRVKEPSVPARSHESCGADVVAQFTISDHGTHVEEGLCLH